MRLSPSVRAAILKFGGRGLSVSISSSVNVALFFARNITIARIIGPSNFGVAVAIATIAALIDTVSDMGWDKFLIQSDQNVHGRAEAQGAVHLLRVGMGVVMAVGVILFAPILANLLQAPKAAHAISALAVTIMLKSFTHIDYKHRQRDLDFTGEAIVETSRSGVDLIAGVTAALILHNYWAMTASITAGAMASCITSHLIARQAYRPNWSAVTGPAVLRFGAPLMINNVFVYAANQGDRLLVGLTFGPHQLALYAAAVTLVAGPQAVISRALVMVSLPLLSKSRGQREVYQGQFTITGAGAVASCALVSLPIILFGPEVVHIAFGRNYHAGAVLTGLLAVALTINILRTWAMTSLMANGKTAFIPMSNVIRMLGFGAAIVIANTGGTVEGIALCLAAGEAIGLIGALLWASRIVYPAPRRILMLLGVLTVSWAAAALVQWRTDSIILRGAVLLTLLAVLLGAALNALLAGRRRVTAARLAIA
jgi:O-antigen/teichoic acid export membrane protein